MTENVVQCFQAIIEDREEPKGERVVDGYRGFLFTDRNGYPEVAMYWEHRFNHMGKRYNDIFRVQMPNITPYICRHTYCSNMTKFGMNPKTLQHLMRHSDISVTINTYTHLGFDDAKDEMVHLEELDTAKKEVIKVIGVSVRKYSKQFNMVGMKMKFWVQKYRQEVFSHGKIQMLWYNKI